MGLWSSLWGKGRVAFLKFLGVWTNSCHCRLQEMAVAVSRDLKVHMLEDVNATKLVDRQQALRAAIQKGEPKCLGVSRQKECSVGDTLT